MGLGAFPGTHRQCLGMLGMHGTYEANMTMHNADVIFAVGVRFDDRTTNNLMKYCPNATVLHIDIDPATISKTVPADVPIVGDARDVLKQMLEMLKQHSEQDCDSLRDWWQSIEQWRARQCLAFDRSSEKIKPQAVIETIWRLTNGDAYVTSDVGNIRCSPRFITPLTSRVAGSTRAVWARWASACLPRWASSWRCRRKPWFASRATAVFR